MNRFIAFAGGLTLLLVSIPVWGQETRPSKVEVGVEFSSLTLAAPGVKREVGVGGRVTYNVTSYLGVEVEGNYFPSGSTRGFEPGGSILQGQLGVKAGKRWNRFGLFAKARPGFVSFDGTFAPRILGTTTSNGMQFPVFDFDRIIRTTHLSLDLGGVVEVYPSRRMIVRFDAGDTMIRYGPHDVLDFSLTPAFIRAPAQTTHNFQFSAGVGFRLMMPWDSVGNEGGRDARAPGENEGGRDARAPGENEGGRVARAPGGSEGGRVARAPGDGGATQASGSKQGTSRFEAGAQVTSLTFNPPRQLSGDVAFFGENRPQTETGLGGRFTFNLNRAIALESVVNYFPTSDGVAAGATGRVLQGQFGVKAGKRFTRFGFFGKVQPGFVSFNRSRNLVGTRELLFGTIPFVQGDFKIGRRTFFANDLGGVLEFYPTRRWALRFDAGDTMIYYGERSVSTFQLHPTFITAPPETRHNFQFSSGFSFRF